ncbi:esterase-like activity of phytase family protein [Psychrobacter sp. GP33]|uniref:esterase-like activity of phytase family protein n=1 Tax=Psychrobacter sp. GP33 TaxID=2758709 RepID=UPI0015FAC322|nr:esterase-like activity of phytase family protein [Psychrobacter sp. GP33]
MSKITKIEEIISINNFIQGSPLPFSILDNQYVNAAYPDRQLEIRNGGFGSDAAAHPTNPKQFYVLTDRGPNADFVGSAGAGKRFLLPEYTPRIGLFELQDNGQITKIKEILLKDANGRPISGLPNPKAFGGTHEVPYDAQGNVMTVNPNLPFDEITNPIKNDINGLDPEGLASLNDGSFWVSDEYGPHLVHYDADGVEIERVNPFTNDARNNVMNNGKLILLPTEFINRRANRGMESLTITPDQSTLVGVMESSMDNPDKSGRGSSLTRIIAINLLTGQIAQYLYRLNSAQHVVSGITAINGHEFYVIEHDRKFPMQDKSAQKHIYQIDMSAATDIIATRKISQNNHQLEQDATVGLTVNSETLEQFIGKSDDHWQLLATMNINPVHKTLVVDVIAELDYSHDKLEGLWLRQDGSLGLLNDDDFGITDVTMADGSNALEQKYLDSAKTIEDANRLYIVTPETVKPIK